MYSAWSASNRSALIRIPASRGMGTRTELRCPDPACNPYLAFAMMLSAGLDGVKNNLTPPPEVKHDIFEMTGDEMAAENITTLPGSLKEAIEEFKASELGKAALGPHIFEKYIVAKEKEWDSFRTHVSEWELEKYLQIY